MPESTPNALCCEIRLLLEGTRARLLQPGLTEDCLEELDQAADCLRRLRQLPALSGDVKATLSQIGSLGAEIESLLSHAAELRLGWLHRACAGGYGQDGGSRTWTVRGNTVAKY